MIEKTIPKPLTFLVLSDPHFGALSASEEFALHDDRPPGIMSHAVSMKDSLIQIALEENIDAILVSGDLTSKGSPQEFIGCMSALNEIAQRIKVSQSNVIYTYGNHDVDWNISRIPNESPSMDLKDLYLKIGASVGDILLPEFIYQDKGPVPGCGLIENETFRIYVVNSGYYCSHDQLYRHGKLGQAQRSWMEDHFRDTLDQNKWNIVLLHHHPYHYRYPFEVEDISCLEEGAFLMDLIGKSGVDFVCHGHRHHPMLFTEMRTGWNSPVTLLCAGSLSVNEQHRCQGQIPNLFHIVTLEKRLPNRAAVGRVKNFEYSSAAGWQPVRPAPHVPLEALQNFADVYNLDYRSKDLMGVINSCIYGTDDFIFDLPEYENLPLSLKCMPTLELNEMIKTHLHNLDRKYRITGEYPKPVIVRR